MYKQYFAKHVLILLSINLAQKVKPILLIAVQFFSKNIYIEKKGKAIKIAEKAQTCIFSYNKSKLDQETGAIVI